MAGLTDRSVPVLGSDVDKALLLPSGNALAVVVRVGPGFKLGAVVVGVLALLAWVADSDGVLL